MGGRDHSCEVCGRGGFNDPGGECECPEEPLMPTSSEEERFVEAGINALIQERDKARAEVERLESDLRVYERYFDAFEERAGRSADKAEAEVERLREALETMERNTTPSLASIATAALHPSEEKCPHGCEDGRIVSPPSDFDRRVGESRRWHEPCPIHAVHPSEEKDYDRLPAQHPLVAEVERLRAERDAARAVADDGWAWLEDALDALGVETVFDIPHPSEEKHRFEEHATKFNVCAICGELQRDHPSEEKE